MSGLLIWKGLWLLYCIKLIPRSEFLRDWLKLLVFDRPNSSILWSSWYVEICRLQGVMSSSTLVLLLLERAYAYLCSGSSWHSDFDTVLAINSFAIFKTLMFFANVHCYIFCNLVSRSYTSLLGCACNEWIFVRIVYGWSTWYVFYKDVLPFGYSWIKFYVPQSLYLFVLIYYNFDLPKKKPN